jgi:hypothetical protein
VQFRLTLRHRQLLQEVVDRQLGHGRPLLVQLALTRRCPAAACCPAKAVRSLSSPLFCCDISIGAGS